jgi:hypothetical protein
MNRRISNNGITLGISLAAISLLGCGKNGEEGTSPAKSPPAAVDEHAHPSHGPHEGSLIELGNEEYHAELVHDERAETVTIFILDSSALAAVSIEATELLVNLSHDGEAEQFRLAAEPDVGDPAGKASRFVSTDSELAEELDHAHSSAQLVVTISGQQFRGAIEHDQEH